MKVSIYKYESVAEFLRDSYIEKRRTNSRFSIRAWAKQMGLKSPTSLHAVIHGKRKIPLTYHGSLVRTLRLSSEEAYFLLALVSYEHAKNDLQKFTYLEKIQVLRKYKNLTMYELANFEALSEPLYTCIIEMSGLKNFENDRVWIQKNNRVTKDINQIKQALQNLVAQGYLKLEEGILKKTHSHISNVPDLANMGSQNYHRRISFLAAEQIRAQPVEDREYNSFSLNVKKEDLFKMKASLREYIKHFITEFEAAPGQGEATYQLNLQLFSLTES
jgi:uncharacterized protein (TIGR02147 family)